MLLLKFKSVSAVRLNRRLFYVRCKITQCYIHGYTMLLLSLDASTIVMKHNKMLQGQCSLNRCFSPISNKKFHIFTNTRMLEQALRPISQPSISFDGDKQVYVTFVIFSSPLFQAVQGDWVGRIILFGLFYNPV